MKKIFETDFSKVGSHDISWCDEVWNWITGCSEYEDEDGKRDPACDNCYAKIAAGSPRLQRFPQYQGVEQWNGTINFVESALRKPLRWDRPRRIFTCSMSDVFHKNVPNEWRDRAFAVMMLTDHHVYQILTKRTQGMVDYLSNPDLFNRLANAIEREFPDIPSAGQVIEELRNSGVVPKSHLWLGTTIGSQAFAHQRMPIINELTQRGWTTFISAEPLLERLDLGFDKGYRVHQVITGAESGKKSKDGTGRKIQSMDEDWVRALRDQCVDANVAFFYKQNFLKGKKVHLPLLDGRQWVEFPVMQKDNNYLKGKI